MKTLFCLTTFGLVSSAFGAPSDAADAAQRRDWPTVRALAQKRADLNAAQPDGTTALQWAAHWNDLDTVKSLLSSGANPKIANRYGVTPLSEAASAGNGPMIEALLAAGADPKTPTTSDGETVLMTAARTGSVD